MCRYSEFSKETNVLYDLQKKNLGKNDLFYDEAIAYVNQDSLFNAKFIKLN